MKFFKQEFTFNTPNSVGVAYPLINTWLKYLVIISVASESVNNTPMNESRQKRYVKVLWIVKTCPTKVNNNKQTCECIFGYVLIYFCGYFAVNYFLMMKLDQENLPLYTPSWHHLFPCFLKKIQ